MRRSKEKRRHLRLRKESEDYRFMEEAANTFTHLIGLVLSVIGLVVLLWLSIREKDAWRIVSSAVYGISLVSLYGISTLYHFTGNPRQKLKLRFWDHCAIYLLIAGSYTPFVLVSLRGGWGWTIFGVVWACAIIGVLLKFFISHRATRVSTFIYLLMGWLAVLAIKPLWDALQFGGIILLIAGGLAYTAGIFFFALGHRRYFHAAWHLCVLSGSILHYLAIVFYVIPSAR